MIRLEDVWKVYEKKGVEVNALQGVSLELAEHEYVSVTGASGSGKTTLLNIMGTIDAPTRGTVYFEDRNITDLNDTSASRLRRKAIGFVFQTYNLLPDLTAWENVALPLYYDGLRDKNERKKRAMKLLERVNLRERATHLPLELSGGEEQRVAIARALINHPAVILADEPTGNLDTRAADEIIALFEDIYATEGVSLVLVTHNLEIAERATRRIQLIDGRIEEQR
ncbi:MAG TPA: ABC transporter ATP-binding protein [Candidatus Cryosericum sp.]